MSIDKWGDLPARALEAIAAEAYRSGALTTFEVQQLLQLSSRWETHALLKRMGAFLSYDQEDAQEDTKTLQTLL